MAWSEDARQRARERCMANQPWLWSTGPRTPEGRARSSLNAAQHMCYSRNNFRRSLARMLALAQQEREEREALRHWLPDAIALKLKNPKLYSELQKIADQTGNELS